MRRLVPTLSVLILLALPALAQAKVPVHGATRNAVIMGAGGLPHRLYVCVDTYLAAKGSLWAIETMPSTDAHRSACRDVQPGDFTILHFANDRWNIVTAGGEIVCPVLSESNEPTVPGKILKELTGQYCDQRPRTPTGYTEPQVKPYRITTTGDGSGFYGGRTGRNVVPPTGRGTAQLGRLKWIDYTATNADATGVEWAKSGPGSTAEQSYRIDATVTINCYRPRNGTFTRMSVIYNNGSEYDFIAQGEYWSEVS